MKQDGIAIRMVDLAGSFAENKDLAQEIRREKILPALKESRMVTLDFVGVGSTTQSFIHALISEVIREYGIDVLDQILFKSCNDKVKKIVSIVTDYMQYEGSEEASRSVVS